MRFATASINRQTSGCWLPKPSTRLDAVLIQMRVRTRTKTQQRVWLCFCALNHDQRQNQQAARRHLSEDP